MTDWTHGYPPPPYGPPPPPPPSAGPPPGPVTPEQLKAIGLQLTQQLALLNGQVPAVLASLRELNARLNALSPNRQATGLSGVMEGAQAIADGLGVFFDPPGSRPPKGRRR